MKTLSKLVLPLTLALCLTVPAVNAHPDRDNGRNFSNDKHLDYRDDFGNRHSSLNRNHRAARKNLDYRRYRPRTERGRQYYRNLIEERKKHRHPYGRAYGTRTSYTPVRNGHYYNDRDDLLSVVLGVSLVYRDF